MFTKLMLVLSLFFSLTSYSYAVSGFLKEGGGYGVKPISQLIKESQEGMHDGVSLGDWLEQREQPTDIGQILRRYKKAIAVRNIIMEAYAKFNEQPESQRKLRRQVLFIQGLLIINISNIEALALKNDIVFSQQQTADISIDSQNVLGVQIEDGYIIIDLLKDHMIGSIHTTILEGLDFYL